MKGSRDEYPHGDGHQDGYVIGKDHASEEDGGGHGATRQPPGQRPMLNNCSVTSLRRFVQTPEGQSGEEYECCPDAVVPLRIVDIDFHFFK